MKLETYLDTKKMKPGTFARQVGVPASTIKRLLATDHTYRAPGLPLMEKIVRATGGDVMPNDFIRDDVQVRAAE